MPASTISNASKVNYLNPRKGTETSYTLDGKIMDKVTVNYLNPRKGTETSIYFSDSTLYSARCKLP